MIENPFFSIIVVSYNAEKHIADTINSVLKQKFSDYEIVVKDGLSKDDTLKCIPKSEKIRVYSQDDCGIYDAMNQAIELSTGKYVCFLNCGDYFADADVLKSIYNTAKDYDDAVIYGDYSRKGVVFRQPSKITDFYLYRTPLCHQTMFISKSLFKSNGMYDTNYKILADYEHTLHDYFTGKEFVHCAVNVCDYMGGGASETPKGIKLKNTERKMILDKYYSNAQQKRNELKLKLSFKKLRQKLISDKSPRWVRQLYRKVVNFVNGGKR